MYGYGLSAIVTLNEKYTNLSVFIEGTLSYHILYLQYVFRSDHLLNASHIFVNDFIVCDTNILFELL